MKPTLINFNEIGEIHKISVAVSQRNLMVISPFPQSVHIAYWVLEVKSVLYFKFFNKN